jgi:hypothetical protein
MASDLLLRCCWKYVLHPSVGVHASAESSSQDLVTLVSVRGMLLLQALGWLALLMPLQQVRECRSAHGAEAWNARVTEWMALWGSVAHNGFWTALWLGLIARLARADTTGVWHACSIAKSGRFTPWLPARALD